MMMVGQPLGPGSDLSDAADSVDVSVPRDAAAVPPEWVLRHLDPSEVPGQWADAGLSLSERAANTAAWTRLRWLWETARARAGTTERVELAERRRPGKIVAATLGVTEGSGAVEVEFARQVLVRLPALGEEMREGRLSERKVRVFTSTLADLDDAQARLVVERLLGHAAEWGYAQLREKVEATARAVDPGWDELRRQAAVARRRVALRSAPSGAAELCGLDLPREAAQDAYDRLIALADEIVRDLTRRGYDAPQARIQADVMLTLAGPDGAGLFDADVVALMVARYAGSGGDSDPGGGPEPGGDGPEPDSGPDDSDPDDSSPDDSDPAGRDEPENGEEPEGGPHPDDVGLGGGGDDGPGDSDGPDDSDGPGDSDARGDDGSARWVAPYRARVAIRIGLRTLLGLDRRPGDIPGHGPVTSREARSLAWARTAATARLILYDDAGHLDHALTLRLPHPGSPGDDVERRRRRRQLVEITAFTREVDDLSAGMLGEPEGQIPAALIAGAGLGLRLGDAFTVVARAARALARARAQPVEEHPSVSEADAHRRRPGKALAGWVAARDQTCRAPACARQAVGADLDHTRDWLYGGRTVAGELGALCRADHLLKHDPRTGWTVSQPHPGHFAWTSPTGRLHMVLPERYDPLPDPQRPADGRPASLPADLDVPAPRVPEPGSARRNRHGHVTDAARETAAHLARRARETSGVPDPGPAWELHGYPDEPPF